MVSTSNNVSADEILAAARACVAEFGIKRTTLAEVARRAGVSRPTVYRRWPDSRSLIAELMTRELREVTDRAIVKTSGTGRDQLVEGVRAGAAAVRMNPLFQKVFRTDADLLLTYVVERLGRSQQLLVQIFAAGIKTGQSDGSIRPGDPTQLASVVLLMVQSAVQSTAMVSEVLTPDTLDSEIAHAIDAYLKPETDR